MLILIAGAMGWRTWRIGSAHREIAKLMREQEAMKKEISDLKEYKDHLESLKTTNPYELLVLKTGLTNQR